MSEPGSVVAPVPYRVRLGVTGHRALADEDALAERVRDALATRILGLFDDDSRRRLQSARNTRLAFTAVSALAEGADRLVAREVLKTAGGDLQAILPLSKEDYLQDFASATSREEFEELLRQSQPPVMLRQKALREEYPAAELEERRNEAYEEGGRWVVDHCDVLLAVWDGQPSRGRGGTAEIVAYAVDRKRPVIIISSVPPHVIRVEAGGVLKAIALAGSELFNHVEVPPAEEKSYVAGDFDTKVVRSGCGDEFRLLLREIESLFAGNAQDWLALTRLVALEPV